MKECILPPTKPLSQEAVAYLRKRFPWAGDSGVDAVIEQYGMVQTDCPEKPILDRRILVPVRKCEEVLTFVARTFHHNDPRLRYFSGPGGGPDGALLIADSTLKTSPQLTSAQWRILVEGGFDSIPCSQVALTFALLGGHIHEAQLDKLFPFHRKEKKWLILLDPDHLHLAVKAHRKLSAWGLEAYIGTDLIPEGKDPGDLTPDQIRSILSAVEAR